MQKLTEARIRPDDKNHINSSSESGIPPFIINYNSEGNCDSELDLGVYLVIRIRSYQMSLVIILFLDLFCFVYLSEQLMSFFAVISIAILFRYALH
jgi:hypothetical protein